jgi:hypothetical protein
MVRSQAHSKGRLKNIMAVKRWVTLLLAERVFQSSVLSK